LIKGSNLAASRRIGRICARIPVYAAFREDPARKCRGIALVIRKSRGQALRLALALEMLWWCGEDGMAPPPAEIDARAFAAAAMLISDYFLPMAERV
jgi:hypothetical protein